MKKIPTMKKIPFFKLYASSALVVAFSLVSFCASTNLFAAGISKQEEKSSNEGRRISPEAQAALVEAQRRRETNPDDIASARQPLIDFLAAPAAAMAEGENPVPLVLYQMLGQFWYSDENAKNSVDEARKVYKAGHEAYPEDEMLLLNYAVTTYELEKFLDAAPLFEKFYDVSLKHEVKYLSYAAAAYYTGEDLNNAKRVFVRMIEAVEIPESNWLESIISICMEQDNQKDTDKYINLALQFYPTDKKYWNLMGNSFFNKEDYRGAASAFEIAARVEAPDKKSQWRNLIDLYNYIGLPLRSANSIQEGFNMLAEGGKKEEQQLLVAEAYARGARVDKAIAYLDGILSKNKSSELLLKKGKILYDARRNKEAIAAFDECIAMNAKAWDAYLMKALAAWDLEDWKMARDAFDQALNSKDYRLQAQEALDMLASLDKAKKE